MSFEAKTPIQETVDIKKMNFDELINHVTQNAEQSIKNNEKENQCAIDGIEKLSVLLTNNPYLQKGIDNELKKSFQIA